MTRAHRRDRGVALVLVLVAVSLVAAATLELARLAGTNAIRRTVDQDEEKLLDLVYALDAPLKDWIETKASSIVLPPEASVPRVPVLWFSERIGEDDVDVEVVAFDECGRVPLEALPMSSPLRLTVPPELRQVVDLTKTEGAAGLDVYAQELAARGRRAFPALAEDVDGGGPRALGAYVSTHSSGIHVHTAPQDVLAAAYRALSVDGVDLVLEARAKGERVAAVPSPSGKTGSFPLLTTSTAWSFRIRATVGHATRSVWLVYQRTGEGWSCVQRLVIHE